MNITAKTKLCLIIGNPVDHSLSPAMHNAAYRYLGIDNKFVYLGSNVKVENVEKVVESMKVMENFHALTCTIPHKIEVMKYLDWIDPTAKKIGAVNSVVKENGILKGFNTDWCGAIIPLEKVINLKNKKVSLIGAGGAARAIIFGLRKKEAKVIIFNRSVEKARKLADEFHCQFSELNNQELIKESDIIINATSVGMKPLEKKTPIGVKNINTKQIVFDIVYMPKETKLLKEAKKRGARVVSGLEMLLHQGTAQFELYTGLKAPIEIMRKVLYGKN